MKILVDENIPFAYELFSRIGKVRTVHGRQISRSELIDVDALMVRSTTKVNESLLAGTSVKFVGTATAGTDHIDYVLQKRSDICFSSAPGCNAIAVVEYIFSALLTLAERDGFMLEDRIVGIVGVGNIGSYLKNCLEALGVRTLLCDPPQAYLNARGNFCSIDELIRQVDILTFHTPLFMNGPYKTIHLANKELISQLKPGAILINSCRGSVVDNAALLMLLEAGQNLSVVLDVWETEPNINIDLLKKVDIGTAHIAGHTLEGKIRGTIQIFEAYSTFIGNPQKIMLNTLLPMPKFDFINLHGQLDEATLKRLVHLVYDIRRDDALLRKESVMTDTFDKLRKNYPERREWSSLYVKCNNVVSAKLLKKLGFNAIYHPA